MDALDRLTIPLLVWYGENKRDLPWRSDPTAYRVLVSELMLQQTRVAAVLSYYERFLRALPTLPDLAAASEEELLRLWQGLGYYGRARNLQKAARRITEDFGGRFPETYEEILTLPGVGEYTAGAVASIAFGVPVPAVDGNVLRVCARLLASEADVSLPATKKEIRARLLALMPLGRPGDYNQALMELGATVCLPNGAPQCGACPARDFCRAHLLGRETELPVRPPKKPRRIEERTVYLLFRNGRVALRRRPEKGLLAGLWEYPHAPRGQDALAAWGISPLSTAPGGTAKHVFTHLEWHMAALLVETADELPREWVWASAAEVRGRYPLSSAQRAFDGAVFSRIR
ncbi:MAG TPA: A/G-specific adenine glycosylase [Oscillospiraceae bacterium]|nr:A/G-specific adenine glycosylase [Oscillospiraceae bacterium]